MLPPGLHFSVHEFVCHDGTPYPEAFPERWIDLRDLCDGARLIHGSALSVISGYRTPDYNAGLIAADKLAGSHGVASGSEHTKARAADLRAFDAPATAVYSELIIAYDEGRTFTTVDGKVRNFRDLLGGIGVYPESNWVHIDTAHADDGHLRRWTGV